MQTFDHELDHELDAQSDVVVVGAGPAGVVAALLFAQRGRSVTLLEAQRDLERDFRGDTVHPSTLALFAQLGLVDDLLALPHQRIERMTLHAGSRSAALADFSRLDLDHPFIAVIPQHLLLERLVDAARSTGRLRFLSGAAVHGVLEADEQVVGVEGRRDGGAFRIGASLVVGADGRFSRLRKALATGIEHASPPMDVAWFRLSRSEDDEPALRLGRGALLVSFPRGDALQLGYVLPKGGFAAVRDRGVDAFRREVSEIAPVLARRVEAIESLDALHLLPVRADLLSSWHRPGLAVIGDAAHAMSPVGGVGINYAIGDAVALAVASADHLGTPALEARLVAALRRRRRAVARMQAIQRRMQRVLVSPALSGGPARLPLAVSLVSHLPFLRGLAARVVGIGFDPPVLPDGWCTATRGG